MRHFTIEGYIQLDSVTEETIFFNSKFESGNLRQAFKVPLPTQIQSTDLTVPPQSFVQQYNLYLQDDTNNDNSLT
jgi:hypothetical protein